LIDNIDDLESCIINLFKLYKLIISNIPIYLPKNIIDIMDSEAIEKKNWSFEFNEQKAREVEVAMYQIEQKVQRLEGQVQNNQNFDMSIMADLLAKIIDQKPSHMLPNVMG